MTTRGEDTITDTADPNEFLRSGIPRDCEDIFLRIRSKNRTIRIRITTKYSLYYQSDVLVHTDDSDSIWVNGIMEQIILILNDSRTNSFWHSKFAMALYFFIGFGLEFAALFPFQYTGWLMKFASSIGPGVGGIVLLTLLNYWLFPLVELQNSTRRHWVFVVIGAGIVVTILSGYIAPMIPKLG